MTKELKHNGLFYAFSSNLSTSKKPENREKEAKKDFWKRRYNVDI